ncbi:hypothetical protein RDWZM_003261 [Blomia tropicalis]|uniref:Peptidase M12B domain-containing protein n=1 Tax=Blomia tropicalis TaxID=40697 RepID=A0A9Q0MEW6_BLOTA|nr:hypothetical protein BLOT_000629 [Blomia tropicalis]KAJ6224716.1 hypothetical protein RDWZM_003261 [Blomia tropicalis]
MAKTLWWTLVLLIPYCLQLFMVHYVDASEHLTNASVQSFDHVLLDPKVKESLLNSTKNISTLSDKLSSNSTDKSIKINKEIRNDNKTTKNDQNLKSEKNDSKRKFQLIEIKPGLHLLEDSIDSPVKTLRISNLFDRNQSLELSLYRIHDGQWKKDFFQLSHFLITNTEKLGFFRVRLEEMFRSQPVHGQPNMNYHKLLKNHTNLYINDNNSSVLLITRLASYVEIYGLITDRLMITPIWRRSNTVLADGWHLPNGFYKEETLNQFYTDERKKTLLHAIIDNHDSIDKHMGFNMNKLMQQIKSKVELMHQKYRRGIIPSNNLPGIPSTIYPEVSLLIDYWSYQNHGRNIDELWRYMLIYFTRIDLIFRQLTSPSVRIRLNDIFVATQPFRFQLAKPKLDPKMAQSTKPYLNSLKAVNEFGAYFYREAKTFIKADLMLVITGQNLCRDSRDSGWASAASAYDSCSYSTVRGQSFVGGACKADLARHKMLNVAIIEDNGFFDGVLVAAHELGHLMGSVHDGQWPISGILGPGGRGCAPKRGYLMSPTAKNKFIPQSHTQFRWSLCSAEQFQYFTQLPQSVCLYDRPAF